MDGGFLTRSIIIHYPPDFMSLGGDLKRQDCYQLHELLRDWILPHDFDHGH